LLKEGFICSGSLFALEAPLTGVALCVALDEFTNTILWHLFASHIELADWVFPCERPSSVEARGSTSPISQCLWVM